MQVRREAFLRSPGPGTAVLAQAYYTKLHSGNMMCIEQRMSRSDTVDIAWLRFSRDHGRTWSAPREQRTGERRPDGMWRRHPRGGFVDRTTGRFIEFWVEGVLPTDNPLEGMRQWNVFCRWGQSQPEKIPVQGVITGKNCVMLGDVASVPINVGTRILVPAVMTPLDSDGRLYNPTGGYTYTDALILIGEWRGNRIAWHASEPIKGDPARCTRGMDEPTLETLHDGRILCILRGSNDRNPSLPSHKWVCFSRDGGWHWTPPAPWTYDDGTPFFSPSACSQLLRHSSGRLFWIGHINPVNPRGNRPRYPLYLGEVSTTSGLLLRQSLVKIDDRQPGDDETLMIYNI
jgi:hypothetical protein